MSIKFITKCPSCDKRNVWHHALCSSYNTQKIDKNGFIKCGDCGLKNHILDMNFKCTCEVGGFDNIEFSSIKRLRKILKLIMTIEDCPKDFQDDLIDNILSEWDRRNKLNK